MSDKPGILPFHLQLRKGGESDAKALHATDHDVTRVPNGRPDIERLDGYSGTRSNENGKESGGTRLRAIPPKKPKLAIIHPNLNVGGGSQARAVWLATASIPDFETTLISGSEIDLDRLDRFYGTALKGSEIRIETVPPAFWARHSAAFGSIRLERYCRANSGRYDIMASAYNIMDFGGKGIQFIADLSFDDGLRRMFDPAPEGPKRFLYGKSPLRALYLLSARLLAGRTEKGWRNNLTIANSFWTKEILKTELNLDSSVIYPPTAGLFPDIPWKEREDGFVVLGRIEPEKRLERILSILGRIRALGVDIHLHILGTSGNERYIRTMENLCRDLGPWATLAGLVEGEEKRALIAQHKYGISGREFEPFGIAVAEMVKAGCLVWVPQGGGQTEIVGLQELIFGDDDEAARKIARVLDDPHLQNRLRRELMVQGRQFSESRFVTECCDLLLAVLAEKARYSAAQKNEDGHP